MAEKMRVHILAKALGVPSKVIIAKCQAEGLQVTNHMSTLSAGLEATIREWFSEGQHDTTIETTDRVDLKKVRKTVRKTPSAKRDAVAGASADSAETAGGGGADDTAIAVAEAPPSEDAAPHGDVQAETPPSMEAAAVIEQPEAASVDSTTAVEPVATAPPAENSVDTDAALPTESALPESTSPGAGEEEVQATEPEAPPEEAEKILPAGPQNVPKPVTLKGPRVVRYEPVEQDIRRPVPRRRPTDAPGPRPAMPVGEAPGAPGQRRGLRGRGATTDRAKKGRSVQRVSPADMSAEKLNEWRNRDLDERKERILDATGRRIHTRRGGSGHGGSSPGGPAPAKTEATVQGPVMMKAFCAATGISVLHIMPILRKEFNVFAHINMELSNEMAEYIALERGVALTIIAPKSPLDEVEEEFAARKPKNPKSRPPVITFLGHVDHGKTSLLDAVRKTDVTVSEDGGITQHIGAYHLEHKTAGKLTFVDTPGHAAFTEMRARGAQITDLVVLLVAADDGVMPQTVEAINHAKAAEVPIVVALNKIDLGTQNVNRIYGQLAERGLQPSGDWGGETDVIHTSATTGQGVDELLEHLTALGEVLDFKADNKCDASGTVIEAQTKEGVGSVARVLVQSGTLRAGNTVVCGNAFGKVRALVDDRGRKLREAGPSIPVEIWGLDEVPTAGDKFYVLKSLQRAKTVAEGCKHQRIHEGRAQSQRVRTLEEVVKRRDASDIPELNVILKADVDGSMDALRAMLSKIPSDEVTLGFRHVGVGPVNDSDVLLAHASDAIIIAFRVVPSVGAKKLAESKGVDIRQYKVIYEVADDIKKALEGLLAPDEKIEQRATCEVREVFNVTKVGTIAGCHVADGLIKRSHQLRLTREGTVVRDNCKIGSLRRFKDDAKEVRAGLECGIRIEGFDDVKPGDIIEAFEIVKIARTL